MIETQIEISDRAIELVDQIAGDLRAGALVRAARAAGNAVKADAKPRITAPGYKGDKADLKPLRDSLAVAVRDYEKRVIAVVGTSWPEGAHGHLVENGHIGRRPDGSTFHVPPHPFLRPAAIGTREEQSARIESVLAGIVR